MSNLVIECVQTRAQWKEFLDFPWKHYRNDPYWVPPLRDTQKEMVNYVNHPFYERNRVRQFLAIRDGETIGRIAAILNHGHNVHYDERRGFFGFFDCRDDQEAANALFDACRQWFADQGIFKLRGPTNPSLNYELGLLIDGFDSMPTFMMTYNPPYYEKLIENYGMRKTQDLFAFWGHISMLPKIGEKLRPLAEQIIERYDVKLRPLDTKNFTRDVEMFLDIYNRALFNTWGFVPMSDGEIRTMAAGLKWLIVPELAVAAEMDGKVVGAAFGLSDYNPRIKEIDGSLFPFGFIKLLRKKQDIKKIRLISTNVLPEYQRYGLGMVLMHGFVPKAIEWGIQEAEFSWVLESNKLSFGALKKGGAQIQKTYRLYDIDFPEPASVGALTTQDAGKTEVKIWRHEQAAASGPLKIVEAKTGAETTQFIRLAEQFYKDDPHWIQPLEVEMRAFLDRRKHPFYAQGDAATFIAYRGTSPVGRIMASDDSNVGRFGMFECENNRETANALLDAAAAWLRKRGRTSVEGPIDYSPLYRCGLLIDGFDLPPRVLMNRNPRYYVDILESWGLKKTKDLCAWDFVSYRTLTKKHLEESEQFLEENGVSIREFDNARFEEEIDRIRQAWEATCENRWGFVRQTAEEFRGYADQIVKFAQKELVLFAEKDGRTIGLSVSVPDVNEAIRSLKGRLTRWGLPIGLYRLSRKMRKIRTSRMMTLAVSQDDIGLKIAQALILRTMKNGKKNFAHDALELCWTPDDDQTAIAAAEALEGRRCKTYRVYEKSL